MPKIPITNNLSTNQNDRVGMLNIPQNVADYMAECYTKGLEFKIDAGVVIENGKPVLTHVYLSAIPAEEKGRRKLPPPYITTW